MMKYKQISKKDHYNDTSFFCVRKKINLSIDSIYQVQTKKFELFFNGASVVDIYNACYDVINIFIIDNN